MSSFVRSSSDAVLIFARPLGTELSARRLDRRVAPLLRLPRLAPDAGEFDVHLFTTCDLELPGAESHRQQGATFGQRLDNAVATLAQLGYRRIVILGRDCPQLRTDDVRDAFRGLDSHRLVLGPDHRGGCWLIALHCADRALLHGIPWQRDRDRDALVTRAGTDAALLLSTKIDLDSPHDLRLLMRSDPALAELVRELDYQPVWVDVCCACIGWARRMIRLLQTPPPWLGSPTACNF